MAGSTEKPPSGTAKCLDIPCGGGTIVETISKTLFDIMNIKSNWKSRLKPGGPTALETLELMGGLGYTTIIESAEPLARRCGYTGSLGCAWPSRSSRYSIQRQTAKQVNRTKTQTTFATYETADDFRG